MNKTSWVLVVVIIILIGGFWYYESSKMMTPAPASTTTPDQVTSTNTATAGTYNYECDEHVTFSMTPSADMTSIQLQPTGSSTYPPAVMVTQQTATSGVRYVGNGVVMTAHGETVTLGTGSSTINCSPQNDPGLAPINFGD
jgi:hypothetical protein